jgi:hypothetical protein
MAMHHRFFSGAVAGAKYADFGVFGEHRDQSRKIDKARARMIDL